jgi:hydrogenase-4 component F
VVGTLLFVLVVAPAATVLLCMVGQGPGYAAALNLVASIVVFAVAVPLTVMSGDGPYLYWEDYIVFDTAGAWVVLCAAIVYALFAGFALAILVSPLMNNAALYWIAIELTTLVNTFLVAFERAAESVEAAWKYIVIVSTKISLALLGTVLFYWNGSFVLGPTYNMTWSALRLAAPSMNPALLVLGFLLVLVGYGTKLAWRRCIPGCRMRIAKARRRFRQCCRVRCLMRRCWVSCAIWRLPTWGRRVCCRASR